MVGGSESRDCDETPLFKAGEVMKRANSLGEAICEEPLHPSADIARDVPTYISVNQTQSRVVACHVSSKGRYDAPQIQLVPI